MLFAGFTVYFKAGQQLNNADVDTHIVHHEHEHHHHHDHDDDCDCDDCISGVSIVEHEGALAGSFEIDTGSKEFTNVDIIIRQSMMMIRDIVNKHHGVIGHIKAAVSGSDTTYMYSLTDKEISVVNNSASIKDVDHVSFVAIVYGLDAIVLRSLLVVTKEQLM